jgi:hypothetical protein
MADDEEKSLHAVQKIVKKAQKRKCMTPAKPTD